MLQACAPEDSFAPYCSISGGITRLSNITWIVTTIIVQSVGHVSLQCQWSFHGYVLHDYTGDFLLCLNCVMIAPKEYVWMTTGGKKQLSSKLSSNDCYKFVLCTVPLGQWLQIFELNSDGLQNLSKYLCSGYDRCIWNTAGFFYYFCFKNVFLIFDNINIITVKA